jgi:hypothetical protein
MSRGGHGGKEESYREALVKFVARSPSGAETDQEARISFDRTEEATQTRHEANTM